MSFRGFTPETAPPRTYRAEPGPVPTIGCLLATDCKWMWAYCYPDGGNGIPCGHRAPMALAPFAIRWGLDSSSDVIRERLRCTKCGKFGATIQHPGHAGYGGAWHSLLVAPFPVPQPLDQEASAEDNVVSRGG